MLRYVVRNLEDTMRIALQNVEIVKRLVVEDAMENVKIA